MDPPQSKEFQKQIFFKAPLTEKNIKKSPFGLVLIKMFIVGTGVPDGPQNTNFGRDIVFSADLCYNEVSEKPPSEREVAREA